MRQSLLLFLGLLQVVRLGDRLRLLYGAAFVIDDDFGEAITFGYIERELERTILDFVFCGQRSAFSFAGLKCFIQRYRGFGQSFRQGRILLSSARTDKLLKARIPAVAKTVAILMPTICASLRIPQPII
jgi:hypothetical protein